MTRHVILILVTILLFAPRPVRHSYANPSSSIDFVVNYPLITHVDYPAVITSDILQISDGISSPENLVYTLFRLPTSGHLRLNGQVLPDFGTFTQADINAKRLVYWNDSGAPGTDTIGFTFSSPKNSFIERVSVGTTGIQANRASYGADMSAVGRYVVFSTRATNFGADDPQDFDQIYVHDRITGETAHVSIAQDGQPAKGYSRLPFISAFGDYIAYSSNAPGLTGQPRPVGSSEEGYLYNQSSKQTEMIWVNPNSASSSWVTFFPSISADGQFLAVWSAGYQFESVWVLDRATGAHTCASWNNVTQACEHGTLPAISRNGAWVAFISGEALLPEDQNKTPDVYLYSVVDQILVLASRTPQGNAGNHAALDNRAPSISADGRFVVFASFAGDLVAGDQNNAPDFFVFDRLSGQNELVTVNNNGEQTGAEVGSNWVEITAISGNGRYIAFYSASGILDQWHDNEQVDLFIRDRHTKTTRQVLLAQKHGASQNLYDKQTIKISDDGNLLLFTSEADWLVDGDTNGVTDVFLAHIDQMASFQIQVVAHWSAYLPRVTR